MRRLILILASLTLAALAHAAEDVRVVDAPRVLVGDLVPTAPVELAKIDVGPAPRPGSSRLFTPTDLESLLNPIRGQLAPHSSVRVVRATRRWTEPELRSWLEEALRKQLPPYAQLVRLEVPRNLLTPASVDIGVITLARLVKRSGTQRASVAFELRTRGQAHERLNLVAELALDSRATLRDITRGTSLTLVVSSSGSRVTASATALADADIGDTIAFQVSRTHKVLRARVSSSREAEVLGE